MAPFSLPDSSKYTLDYQGGISKQMSRILHTIIILFTVLCCTMGPLRAQNAPIAGSIERAIRAGDAGGVSRYFGNTVDITINNNQATYNRTQGELVLRDFFGRNSVTNFTVEHTGAASASNSVFTIGSLTTSNGKYRVYILIRQHDGASTVSEIRFQR